MQDSALTTLDALNPADGCSIALFNENWHQGVIGILASRLKDKFHRPVIAFARAQTGELKGSGRSIAGLHLRDALDLLSKRQPHLIQKFGGHAMAAGLSIREEHFNDFQLGFESVARELLDAEALVKTITTDGALDASEFSLGIARDLQRQVWGQGFPEPLFEGDFQVQAQRVVGEKHLKLTLRPCAGQGLSPAARSFDGIRFFSAEPAPDSSRAIYSLTVNEYQGNENLQLIVRHWESIDAGRPPLNDH